MHMITRMTGSRRHRALELGACLLAVLLVGCGGEPELPPPDEMFLTVQVYQGDKEDAAAGAEVRVLDPHVGKKAFDLTYLPWIIGVRGWSGPHRCDDQGCARIPMPRIGTFIHARIDDGEGWTELVDPLPRVKVGVFPHKRVTIQAVDPGGRPCPGVQVVVRPAWQTNGICRGVTSAHGGRVTLRTLAPFTRRMLLEDWSIDCPLVRDRPRTVRFKAQGAREHTLRVVVPETGRVEVKLEGYPPQCSTLGRGFMYLQIPHSSTEGEDGFQNRDEAVAAQAFQVQPVLTPDRVVFPRVALNRKYKAQLVTLGGGVTPVTFAGPERPGETVTVSYPVKERTVLRGRLVGPKGKPWASQVLLARGDLAQPWPRIALETDAAGRFTLLARWGPREGRPRTLELETLARWENRWSPLRAVADLPPPDPGGTVDLGDLELAKEPFALAGRVVDLEGRPIPGVRFELAHKATPKSDAKVRTTFSGSQGRFCLRAVREEGSTKLRFGRRGFIPAEAEQVVGGSWSGELWEVKTLEWGRSDLRLVMKPAATVSGRILVSDRMVWDHLRVEVEGKGVLTPELSRTLFLSGSGAFHDHLEPGRYQLRIQLLNAEGTSIESYHSDPTTLVTLPPFTLRAGETWRPPEKGRIDLRKSLRPYCIQVAFPKDDFGREAELVAGNNTVILTIDRELPLINFGVVSFVWRAGETRFRLRGRHLRTQAFINPPPGHKIHMQLGYGVNLRLRPPLTCPVAECTVRLELEARDHPHEFMDFMRLPTDHPDNTIPHLHLPLPGPYRWTIRLFPGDGDIDRAGSTRLAQAREDLYKLQESMKREIHLADKESPQALTITLPPALHSRLQKILDTLR